MSLKNSFSIFGKNPSDKKHIIPSLITQDVNILGNIVSDGNVDFDGAINGNIRCHTLTIRANGSVKGEITADNVFVYGKVKGLIRAKNVHLYATCKVEGIIMHETIAIEDGAFVDGKFKRTDKPESDDESSDMEIPSGDTDDAKADAKILDNIRLIR